jgi:hypothetical protein
MATKAFHIELKVTGIDTADRMQALTEALQRAGRQLHSDAVLICGDTTVPKIELYGEDLNDGKTDIPIGAAS